MNRINLLKRALPIVLALLIVSCKPFPSIPKEENGQFKHSIAYYSFDDGSFNDSSGNGYDGEGVNEPAIIDDTPSGDGYALMISSSLNQSVSIPHGLLNNLKDYSVTLWIKDFSEGVLISSAHPMYNNINHDYPRLVATDNGSFQFVCCFDKTAGEGLEKFAYNFKSITNDGWHHIAVTSASLGKNTSDVILKLYVDGQLTESLEEVPWESCGYREMTIGGNKNGAYSSAITAKFDNIGFYNITLTDSDILAIFNDRL